MTVNQYEPQPGVGDPDWNTAYTLDRYGFTVAEMAERAAADAKVEQR